MSQLVRNSFGFVVSDTVERKPDARYWIPSVHELIKAAYWDPNKDGIGGYWQHPNSSDTPLAAGLPGEPGAERIDPDYDAAFRVDVGLFPNAASPWGLLDVSGHWREATDSRSGLLSDPRRFAIGSNATDQLYAEADRLGAFGETDLAGSETFRIATRVPAVPTVFLMATAAGIATTRRRRP
jgi:hypothetical protein